MSNRRPIRALARQIHGAPLEYQAKGKHSVFESAKASKPFVSTWHDPRSCFRAFTARGPGAVSDRALDSPTRESVIVHTLQRALWSLVDTRPWRLRGDDPKRVFDESHAGYLTQDKDSNISAAETASNLEMASPRTP